MLIFNVFKKGRKVTTLMCGFCGFTGSVNDPEHVIREMAAQIASRGPDDEGVYFDENISLGFKRLSIIDLTDGAQPMQNQDGSVVVVYNGEIYNYKKIRESLISQGHTFKTSSDTEVLIHSYEQYGVDFLTNLRGMFSFVLWDKQKHLLFGARDYFGIKPLFYSVNNGEISFASELKSLLKHPLVTREFNEEALENYLSFQYSVLPESFFKGIYRLPPAHYFVFKDGAMTLTRYWEPVFSEDSGMPFEEAVKNMAETIDSSIKAHMVSDVEVGSFLSSGVDSSYVAATFKGAKTFTVGFDQEKYNEISYAKKLSKTIGVENYSRVITKDEYWSALPKIMYCMDEPLADPAAVALYFVSELASKHVKVALSGEGADELFGGYNIYKEPMALAPMNIIPLPARRLIGKAVSAIPFSFKGKNYLIRAGKPVEERFIGNAYMFTKKERDKILKNPKVKYTPESLTKPYYNKVRDKDDVAKMQYIDIHFWLIGDILLKADRMSMAHSLELRTPLLDVEVCNMAMRLPTEYKVGKKGTKLLFRAAAAKRLPKETAEKKKLGFPVPIRVWLKEDWAYNKVKQAFESAKGADYFNKKEIIRLLDEHKSGKKDNSRKIWTIYIFLVWYGGVFEKAAPRL